MNLSNFTHILAQLFEKLSFLVQLDLFWRSVIFLGVQKKPALRLDMLAANLLRSFVLQMMQKDLRMTMAV